ncbi:MAG: hypothetical protein COZ18_08655 [Flexibacter sp. CG_4_10_14_3_um_filter_32_15]|nr:MAG: hypothetical protein COZ18_08655 [Flexibacter sp. CG_4_10_14_3_um_filter_32_15]
MYNFLKKEYRVFLNGKLLTDKDVIEECLEPLRYRDNQISFLQQETDELKKEAEENKKLVLEFAKFLKSQGVSAEEINQKTKLSIEEISEL